MDAWRFDELARGMTETGSRRALLGILASLPVLDGLFALLHPEDGDAQGRRKRRKKAHKHGRRRRRQHHPKRCHPKAKTCAGKCGPVKNNCQRTVDYGACACDPPCSGTQLCVDRTCVACDVCPTCPYGTVQAAVADASGPNTIYVCPGTYTETITIARAVTLIGAGQGMGASDTILHGNGATVVTNINQDGAVSLQGLRITGGATNSNGGGVHHLGDLDTSLTMIDCTVAGNTANVLGGGIAVGTDRTLTMTDCTVSGNTANQGGGIYTNGLLKLNATDVTGNSAGSSGGGIELGSGTVSLNTGSNVCGNTPDQCVGFTDPACQATCPP